MKTGLIVEGGGMKDAYNAGVLDAFLDHGISFDYVAGVSAGATCAASYLAGQRDRNRRFFTVHPKNPEYFGLTAFLKSGDIFNLHYIYDTLTNEGGADPLDYRALKANPTEFVIVATDAATGKPRYFTKDDVKVNDSRIFKATCCLPGCCRPIRIDDRLYFDGGVSDSIPIKRAFHDGVDRLVIILSKPLSYVMDPQPNRFLYTYILHRYPRIIWRLNHRHERYNRQHEHMMHLYREGRVFLFAPTKMLSTFTMDTAALQSLYDEGLFDGIHRMSEMKKFLKTV